LDIEGEDADGVEGVQEDEGAAVVSAADEGLQGDAVGAAVEDVGQGHDTGTRGDAVDELFDGRVDGVAATDDDGPGPAAGLFEPEVVDGREVVLAEEDLGPLAREVERGGEDGLEDRDVLVENNAAGGRTEEAADLIAEATNLGEPVVPGGDAFGAPFVGVLMEGIVRGAGHSAQGVGDEVGAALEDGELVAPTEKRVVAGHSSYRLAQARTRCRLEATGQDICRVAANPATGP